VSQLWGGRFTGSTADAVRLLNDSYPFDKRLWRFDIEGSVAHATMLGETGIISPEEATQLVQGLRDLTSDPPESDAEDVHSAVEGLLREKLGSVAGKLHTARSRNDQVATDLRLFVRSAIDDLVLAVQALQGVLVEIAGREKGTLMPGYTHLQRAQPVLLSHHLLAYFWMLQRDVERFSDCRRRVNQSPLGACALAGTSFPINRERTAELLGFEGVMPNSMDAVSDRDFAVEFLSCCSLLAVHLSRLGEEIVLWNSHEFGFLELHDSVATGSSIMPQKKNPDVAELARGKVGRIVGALVGLLTTLKGLPLAYNKDLQEDKEPVFDAFDTLVALLPALAATLSTAQFKSLRMREALAGDFSTAVDLADACVRSGMSFREAHEKVGRIVLECLAAGKGLEEFEEGHLSPEACVQARVSQGAASLQSVEAQLLLAMQALSLSGPVLAAPARP
jgi:argininosuccinate lyase